MTSQLMRTRPLRIACLGWGSLVWDPRALPVRREWFKDGPFVPIEFARQSENGRITLVIEQAATPIRVLWAHMVPDELSAAKEALRGREGILLKNSDTSIGSWRLGEEAPPQIPELPQWSKQRGLDAVVWTALAPRFADDEGRRPSAEEVIDYLRALLGTAREHAKEYVERAPRQIDTEYRRRIEAVLGWSCNDDN